MTDTAKAARRGIVISIRDAEYRVGPKWILAILIAAGIVALGVWVSPANGWAGVGIGASGILGAILGILIQPDKLPPDLSREAASAVRGLLDTADAVDGVARLTTQLSSATSDERVAIGLITVQDNLEAIRLKMFLSMAEWNAVAPDATGEVKRLEDAGQEAFNRLRSKPS